MTEDAELLAVGMDDILAKALMFDLNYGQLSNGDDPDAVSAGAVYRL